jgi:hypothetical protein
MTEHGTPVARLIPIERPGRPAILARLEAEGRLRPAENPGYLPQWLHPVADPDPSAFPGTAGGAQERALIASGRILGRRSRGTPVA